MSSKRVVKPRKGDEEAEAGQPGRPHVPAWLPPVLYGALTLFLFRSFVFTDRMLFGSDTLGLGYMARSFYADVLASGAFPRWNPLLLGGTPFLESLAGGDALYPTSLLLLVMEPHRALGWKLILHVFLAGLLMFGWVRVLGLSRATALVAGLAYGFAPLLVSFVHPGHDGKLFVTALTPLLFWVAEKSLVAPSVLSFVTVAAVIGLVLFTTHFQLAYFLFGGVGLYYLFRVGQLWRGVEGEGATGGEGTAEDVPRARRAAALTRLGSFLLAALAGAALAGIQLVPAVSYVLEHSRRTATTTAASEVENVAYSSSWSLHPEEALSFVVPEFAGNDAGGAAWARDTYWGRNGIKDNHEYFGVVVLVLAGLSFAAGAPRRGLRLFFVGLGTTALLFALGQTTPVWRIFYEILPGVRLFRAPSTASFLLAFSGVTLAAFGVERALGMVGAAARSEPGPRERAGVRYLWIATGVLALLALLAASGALVSFWTSVVNRGVGLYAAEALARARPFIVRGAFFSAALAAATAATVWAGRRGLLKGTGVLVLLGSLLAVDALRIDRAFIETLDFREWAAPDANISALLDRQEVEPPFRVADLSRLGQNVRAAMFGLELAGGHHPNDLARYRELIGMRGSQMPVNLFNSNVLSLLNVRYLIWPNTEIPQEPPLEPVSMTEVGGRPYETVYRYPGLPRARLVGDARVVPDEEMIEAILDPAFDPGTTVLLEEEPPLTLPGAPVGGEVSWEERGINRMRLRVRSDAPALLVLADNWFPSWRATVDGAEVPVLRAYHTLRAVPVTAGEHTVELSYRSGTLRGSLALSLVTAALLLGLGALSWSRSRSRDAPVSDV